MEIGVISTARAKRGGGARTAKSGGKQRQRVPEESRSQLLERLINPIISLRETGILLEVCPATVRRYSDRGLLPHVRTTGRQRRFYFRDVLALVQKMEAKRNAGDDR